MATSYVTYGVPSMSVVGDGFCVPYPVELIVKRNHHGLFDVGFDVLDFNGNLFLHVDDSKSWIFQKKLVMRDPSGFPILSLREKSLDLEGSLAFDKVDTSHHRWAVHRGESSNRNNLIFSVQRSHPLQMKARLDVFLASNLQEDIGNFQVVGCYSSQSFKVYKGDTLIAEVNDNSNWGSFLKGKEKFGVRVYAGVDYAFIVALLVILNESDII